MFLVKVDSHPPLQAFAFFSPLHTTAKAKYLPFFFPFLIYFPSTMKSAGFHHTMEPALFVWHTLTAHYIDVKRKKGAGNEISRQNLNTKTFFSSKHSVSDCFNPEPAYLLSLAARLRRILASSMLSFQSGG